MLNKETGITFLLIFIILITGLVLINFTGVNIPYLSYLGKGVYNIITPPLEYFTKAYNFALGYWNGLLNVDNILKENAKLEEKVASLNREILLLNKFKRENQRLRELLAFKKYVNYTTQGAKVIGLDPSNWKNKIIIDKGANDGLQKKMPVISYNGSLVGYIDYVGANSSQVKLINDPDFVVGGIVQREESRAIGLVKGELKNENMNIMDQISWDADIKKGDFILTSGLSNNYPKGLPIGKVVEVNQDNYGLSQKAKIELFSSLKTIEEVLVITQF